MPDPTYKLATIVFTDIVGFTKLSAENEPLAIQLLEIQRTTLKPIVERHNGSWLKEIGDGLLLTFDTTKDAVDCSIEMQHTVKNVANLDLRIGIHQGEVVIQGNDILGDDVNVASRIEPFASPGGIVVTNRVNASLLRDPVYQTKLVGKPALKGVRQEVKLHCIISHGLPETDISKVSAKMESKSPSPSSSAAPSTPPQEQQPIKKSSLPLIVGGIIGAVIIAGIAVFFVSGSKNIPGGTSGQVSIACLPFVNMSADKENEYFSDGITEEILNYLAKIKNLRVISRTSSFTYKDKKDISLAEIGKQLNVSHVLEGSVRKAGQKVRITAQLIKSGDDAHLWSETYDRELKDIFAVQDEIAQTIVNTLEMDYIGHTENTVEKKRETSLEAYNLYLQGLHFQTNRDEAGMRMALSYFNKTVKEDPTYELAYVGLANTYLLMADYGYKTFDESLPLAEYNSNKALELNPNLAEVQVSQAYVSLIRKDSPDKTEKYFKKAIQLNPNYARAQHWYSDFLKLVIKDQEKAYEYATTAYNLDPLSPIVSFNLADVCVNAGYLDKGEEVLKKTLVFNPQFFKAYGQLSIIYRMQGRWDEAEKTAHQGTEVNPEDGNPWRQYSEILSLQGKHQEAIRAMEKMNSLMPNSSFSLEFLSIVNYFAKNYSKVKEYISQAKNISQTVPLGRLVEGWLYYDEKKYEEAIEAFDYAQKIFLGLSVLFESMAITGKGCVYADMGETEMAKSMLLELEKFTGTTGITSLKGIILMHMGNKEKGYNILKEQIKKNDPYVFLKIDSYLKPYRNEAKFKELLKLYNLG